MDENQDKFGLDRLPIGRDQTSMSDLLRLDSRLAVVTGGGGQGLGAAICHRLGEQGAHVAVLDVSLDAARETANAVHSRWGVPTIALRADVGDWEEVSGAVDELEVRAGVADILVHNAGGSGLTDSQGRKVPAGKEFASMTSAEIAILAQLNFVGTLFTTRAVLPGMLERGNGRIVLIASEGGKVGLAGGSVYADSKAGTMSLTRTLAQELGPRGVSLVCVSPGLMIGERHLEAIHNGGPFAALLARAMERVSLGRPGVYDEVATAVAFFASPAGQYAHGTTVSISGGMSD